MRTVAAMALALALAGMHWPAAARPSDPFGAALSDMAAALQDRAFLIGVCERHRPKAELDDLAAFLAIPDENATSVGRTMRAETRDAYESGKAQATRRNWDAARCDRAIDETLDRQEKAKAELERLEADGQ